MLAALASRVLVCLALLFTSAACPGTAFAQPEAVEVEDEEARALFQAGRAAYRDGRFGEAADHFQRAYELSGLADFLYNVGSAAERAGQDQRALEAYRAYLASETDRPARARAEGRVRELEARQAALDAAAQARLQEPGPTAPPLNVLPWLTLGVGGALLAVGGVLLGLGLDDQAVINNPPPNSIWTDVRDREPRGRRRIRWGGWLLGLGGISVVAGVLWALAAPSSSPPSGQASLRVDVGFGSLHLCGRF